MGSPNRQIIIPKGTLNSDDVNVVLIPRGLENTCQPLVVRPAPGNKLTAQSVPIWGDNLDTSGRGPPQLLQDESEYDPTADDSGEIWQAEEIDTDFETSRMCASPPSGAPQIIHMSSKTVSVTNFGPPNAVEVSFDAPEGVDQNVFQAVMGQSASRGNVIRSDYQLPFGSTPDEMDFNPPFNSTFTSRSEGIRPFGLKWGADTTPSGLSSCMSPEFSSSGSGGSSGFFFPSTESSSAQSGAYSGGSSAGYRAFSGFGLEPSLSGGYPQPGQPSPRQVRARQASPQSRRQLECVPCDSPEASGMFNQSSSGYMAFSGLDSSGGYQQGFPSQSPPVVSPRRLQQASPQPRVLPARSSPIPIQRTPQASPVACSPCSDGSGSPGGYSDGSSPGGYMAFSDIEPSF